MHTLDAISCTAICLFSKISSLTWQMFTYVTAFICTWACGQWATCSQPSENLLHQSYTFAHDKVSSSYCALNLWIISASFTFNFTRNLVIQHCSTLRVTVCDAILYCFWCEDAEGTAICEGVRAMFPPSSTKSISSLWCRRLLKKKILRQPWTTIIALPCLFLHLCACDSLNC
jgi:hypothetical protein